MSNDELRFVPMPRYIMRKNALSMMLRRDQCAGKRLLEIGYGAGEIFNLYEKLGVSADGYDQGDAAYEYAREHYKSAHVIKEREQIEKGRYDYVVACEVLEHCEDDIGQLREWSEYLSPAGKMILSVPAHQRSWGADDVYAGHFRRYEREELKRKLETAGMRPLYVYVYDFPACLILDSMRRRTYDKKIKSGNLKKEIEERTEKSGIERDYHPVIMALSRLPVWTLVSWFERLFYRTDLGSAYILMAERKP